MRAAIKMMELETRYRMAGRTIWIDYGWMRLPFHSDGDLQELYYHLNGDTWWENEHKLLARYIGPGSVVVDVGANIGFLTTLFAKLVGASGTVHSFEPSPITFRKLQEVIEANDIRNVHSHNVGCGERAGVLNLYYMRSSGHASLHQPEIASGVREVQNVPIVRLDDYLRTELVRLDFLKIDTEGFDDSVLAGAGKLIEQFRPVVYIELTSEYINASRRAVALLKAAKYQFIIEPVLEHCHNGQNFIALPA